MYSTPSQVEMVLAQSQTTASPSSLAQGTPKPMKFGQVGTKMNPSLYTTDIVNYYIQLADAHIDAALSQQYVTPVPELCSLQLRLTADLDEYSTSLHLDRASALSPGDSIVITDGINTERLEVQSVGVTSIVPVAMPTNLYYATMPGVSNTRVMRVTYPFPISFLSARLAAAGLFDKFFASQQEPGKTEYGEKLRQMVTDELNNIREGKTILVGVKRVGWRFANPNLVDRYALKGQIEQDGTRSSGGAR